MYDQGLSHNLETGCPKMALVKSLGVLIFKGTNNILKNTIILNMYLLIEIRHNVHILCHRNNIAVKKIQFIKFKCYKLTF